MKNTQLIGLCKKEMEKEMKNTTKLLFGIHMHQPIDNFDWVIKHGVEVCYGPFFEVMSKYPQFKFAVHCSGWLMEEIKKKHPKVYKNIKYLADQGSIEFFSAGYYEPILSVIPSVDFLSCLYGSEPVTQNLDGLAGFLSCLYGSEQIEDFESYSDYVSKLPIWQ